MVIVATANSFNDIASHAYAGARDTIDMIRRVGMEDEFMTLMDEMFYEPVGESELNDFLMTDRAYIMEYLLHVFDDEDEEAFF